MKRIAFIPIDNRPVCYTLPEQIAKTDKSIEILMPPRDFLGGLYSKANVDEIINWLENIDNSDILILSLDTIAYGGLISSRRGTETLSEIEERLKIIKNLLKIKAKKVYAVSSIMRISNNNVNEEEKSYWSEYGKKIFKYSYEKDKFGNSETDVPKEILKDYLETRKRNFEVNKIYLKWAAEGIFEKLVFSKDDCAEFGLNVREAKELQNTISKNNLPAMVKTGADEIPLSLFSRAISDYNNAAPKISVKFLAPHSTDLISNYEDVSIKNCVEGQIELAGGKITEKAPDITLLVNNFEQAQGEIVMNVDTKMYNESLSVPKTPYMVADVRFANGADNNFVKELLKDKINLNNFYGFSAWNTSANTIGSLICAAFVRFFAKNNFNINEFKKLQFVRFADDWGYQANVRQILKKRYTKPEIEPLANEMKFYTNKINEGLNSKFEATYNYPWKRFFEVEIIIK